MEIQAKGMVYIALDIGGTKVSGALIDAEGNVVFRGKRYLEGRGGVDAASLAADVVRELLSLASAGEGDPLSLGVSIPGVVWPGSGRVWAPNIPGWGDFPLGEFLGKAFADYSLRVFIESDRTCHLLGEYWKGNARGCPDAVFIAVGTGIGVGMLCGGKIIRGSGGIAGAAGWMALQQDFEEGFSRCGCFEYYGSGLGMALQARERLRHMAPGQSALQAIPVEEVTAADLFRLFDQGDPVATSVVGEAIRYWGRGAANLVSLLNPTKVIWGGGLFGPAARFLEEITAEASRWAQPLAFGTTTFVLSALGQDAALIGAGYLAMKEGAP